MEKKNYKNDNTKKKNCHNLPPPIDKDANSTSSDHLTNNNAKNKLKPKFTIADLIQICLLIANIIMIIAFLIVSKTQSRNTQDALKRADTSNSYTRQSVAIMDSTMKFDNRAYLVVYHQGWGNPQQVDNRMWMHVSVKNDGRTPAYEVRCSNIIWSYKFRKITNQEIKNLVFDTTQSEIMGSGVICSLGTFVTNCPRPNKGESEVMGEQYLFGIITYKDIFKVIHYTQFCGSLYNENFTPMGNQNKAD